MAQDSDDELADVVEVVRALGDDATYDDGIGDVLRRVREACPAERYKRRGELLCNHMRAVKAARRSAAFPQVASHVQERVKRMNADYAVRAEDHIDFSEKRPKRIPGRGRWRHWLPAAILRCCWGLRPQPRSLCRARARCTTKRPPPTKPSPLVASARCVASFYRAGHAYVQDIRNAVARKYVVLQRQAFDAMGQFDSGIFQIALDETEMPLALLAVGTKAHVIVIHARLTMRRGQQVEHIEVVVPPAALESTSAAHLLRALQARMPFSVAEVTGKCRGELTMVLSTDSGRSCLKLARHLQALPAACRMHQHCLAMTAPMRLGGVMSSLFCATLLMKRHRVQTMVTRQLSEHVAKHLNIVYERPGQEQVDHVSSVLDLLGPLLDGRLVDPRRSTVRKRALARLKVFLCGPLRDGPALHHYCPYGCHSSLQAAQTDLVNLILALFVQSPPPTPAWNKWTKVWPPLVWFGVIMQLSHVLPACLAGLCSLASDPALDIDEDDIVGLDDKKAFERQEQARFRKTSKWLNAAITRDKMLALTLSIQYSLAVMGSFFASARRFGDNARCMTALANPATSVAAQCLRRYFNAFSCEQHALWAPLVGGGRGWSTELYCLASTPALLEVGSLYKRFVLALACWPWRLSLLCAPGVSDAEKRAVALQLWESSVCCLDAFSWNFRARCSGVGEILSEPMVQSLRDVFDNTPLTNIGSENRFASLQTRWSSSHGHMGSPSTLASDHVLAESKLVLDSTTRCATLRRVTLFACVCRNGPLDVKPLLRLGSSGILSE